MTPLDQALRFAARGLCVIPVPRPGNGHNGKIPTIAWRTFQTQRPNETQLRAWFSGPPMNLAIVTGAVSAVVAVDCDSDEALAWATLNLPYTDWQTETASGWHLFYRHPGTPIGNRARLTTNAGRLALDVRGDGGYVIAPGSIHESGAEYREAGDWDAPHDSLPIFEPAWATVPVREAPRRQVTHRSSAPVRERARRYLEAIPRPVIGGGSDAATLYAACRLVRGFGLDPAEAEALLWDWAGGRPGWTRGWVARKVDHALRYGTEAIGSLAS